MELTNGIYWKDNSHWLGYFKDYPDYWTQGESLEDLQAHLLDLYRDLSRNDIRSNIFKLF
jgi:predicted RNase H-like HicB family nuclease